MKAITSGKLIVFFLAALTAAVFSISCSSKAEGQDQAGGQNKTAGKSGNLSAQGGRQTLGDRGGEQEAVPVEVISPWRTDLNNYVYGNAHIEANRVVDIVARVDGQLEALNVEEGDVVKSGQVLARLNRDQLRLTLEEARAQLENARNVYDRDLKMLAKELTSQESVDKSNYQFQSASTAVERAELNLRYATIVAPFDGIVTKRSIELGGLIRTNMVLFTMADLNKLLARVYVPEKEMARINVGNPVQIASEMIPDRRFEGEVEMISPVVDPATGTIKVTVHVTHGFNMLKPGMFCSVFILTDTHEGALVISRKALLTDTENPEVFVVDDSMHAHRHPIEIGIQQGDTLEVTGGLSEMDKVVLIGQENLHEGTPVILSGGAESRTKAFRRSEVPASE